ncbi:MAG: hypothetical protein OEV55_05485 [candidate division Zixibacteria bacterium]|nr:hypothetical protein [candidate division Zixibacteria bacterium]
MRKIFLITLILLTVLVSSSSVLAEETIVFSESNKPVLQAMKLSLKSNSLSYLYTMQSTNEDLAYKDNKSPDSLKLKDPREALFYAILPGFIVHGAGHFYAGKPKTGAFLVVGEVIGAGLIFLAGLASMPDNNTSSSGGVDAIAFIGVSLFAVTWLYDIVESPFVVKRNNQRILGKNDFIGSS